MLLFSAMAALGCKDKLRILNPRVTRNPVVFETPQGAGAFEDALDERYDRGDADVKQVRGRLSKNAFFNQQIERADENGDGIISDKEALRYVERTEDDDAEDESR
jgi:hypothetical protein